MAFYATSPEALKASEISKKLFDNYKNELWRPDYLSEVKRRTHHKTIDDKLLRASTQWLVMALYLINVISFDIVTKNKSKQVLVRLVKKKRQDDVSRFVWQDDNDKWAKLGY